MTQVFICTACQKIHKTNGKESCGCGCNEFRIKYNPEKKSIQKKTIQKKNNLERKNLIHIKIEFYTTNKLKKIYDDLLDIIKDTEEKIMIEKFCKIKED